MPKTPISFPFYPGEWLTDIKLQSCTAEARGIFINLKCIMHQSDKCGYLLINGSIPSLSQISSLAHTHHKTLNKRLIELVSNGVIKQDKDGAYYCPRMVADEELRQARRKAGRLGGLARQRDLPKQKPDIIQDNPVLPTLEKIKAHIERACDYLCENEIFPEAREWKNEMLEQGKSERIIMHALMKCAIEIKSGMSAQEFCAEVIENVN